MPMDLLSGIMLPKHLLIKRLQERMPGAIEELPEHLRARLVARGIETPNRIHVSSRHIALTRGSAPLRSEVDVTCMSVTEAHSFLVGAGLCLNKTEFDNLFEHFNPNLDSGEDKCDMVKFTQEVSTLPPGAEPVRRNYEFEHPVSPYTHHLSLSGVSHTEFGVQDRPFPAHWGVPPNHTMKGHMGVVRNLPDGYGKGNGPMENWVKIHVDHDRGPRPTRTAGSPSRLETTRSAATRPWRQRQSLARTRISLALSHPASPFGARINRRCREGSEEFHLLRLRDVSTEYTVECLIVCVRGY